MYGRSPRRLAGAAAWGMRKFHVSPERSQPLISGASVPSYPGVDGAACSCARSAARCDRGHDEG